MINEQMLLLHDELEKKVTARPWSSNIRTRPGYGNLVFWSRKPHLEAVWQMPNDAMYLTYIRNIAPDLVEEIRSLRKTAMDLSTMVIELQTKLNILEEETKNGYGSIK